MRTPLYLGFTVAVLALAAPGLADPVSVGPKSSAEVTPQKLPPGFKGKIQSLGYWPDVIVCKFYLMQYKPGLTGGTSDDIVGKTLYQKVFRLILAPGANGYTVYSTPFIKDDVSGPMGASAGSVLLFNPDGTSAGTSQSVGCNGKSIQQLKAEGLARN